MAKIQTWTKEKIEYMIECRKDGNTWNEAAAMLFTEHAHNIKGMTLKFNDSKIEAWIYMLKDVMNAQEAIDDYITCLYKPKRIKWKNHPEWVKTFEDNFNLPYKEIAYILFTKHGIKPTISSLNNFRGRHYKENLIQRNVSKYEIDPAAIHPDIYIKPGFVVEHSKQKIPVICYAEGHETMKTDRNIYSAGCGICKTNFVGGLPIGDNPALVYLLDFEKVNKSKIGYAELGGLSPIKAIHRTSRGRYPWSYKIAAYDLSTKTKAGKYEQELLDDTIKNKAFVEPQEFDGATEFRTRDTIKQLRKAGEFETWLK